MGNEMGKSATTNYENAHKLIKLLFLSVFLSPAVFNSSVSAQLICVISKFRFPVL